MADLFLSGHRDVVRGIDPAGLTDLAETVAARGTFLEVCGREAATLISGWDAATARRLSIGIEQPAGDCAAWSRALLHRAELIEAGQQASGFGGLADLARAAAALAAPFAATTMPILGGGVVDAREDHAAVVATVDAIRGWLRQGWDDWDVTRSDVRNIAAALASLPAPLRGAVVRRLGADDLVRWVEEMTRAHFGLDAPERVHVLADLLEGLDAGAVFALAEAAAVAGRGFGVAAEFGDAVAAGVPAEVIVSVVARIGSGLDETPLARAVLVARAVGAIADPAAATTVATTLLEVPGRLERVLRAASVSRTIEGSRTDPVTALVDLLAAIGDPEVAASAVVAMATATDGPYPAAWSRRLDEAIAQVLASAPSDVFAALAGKVDPEGGVFVPWVRRLFSEPHGPGVIGTIVAATIGPVGADAGWLAERGHDPAVPFPHAEAAGYLAGALGAAAQLEAGAALDLIVDLGAMAALGEALASAWTSVAPAFEALIPGALDLSVDGFGRSASSDVDSALRELIEQIDERFEPIGDLDTAGLVAAWLAFDARRDALVRAVVD